MKGLLCELVPFTEADASKAAEWLTANQAENLLRGTSSMFVRQGAYSSLDSGDGRAALVLDKRDNKVGLVHWWRLGSRVYEIGGAVIDERLWRTGVGIEAGFLVVDYLFEVMNCRRVEFTTGFHNSQTINISLVDDMTIEAICRDYIATPNGRVPAVKSSLTRDEYYEPYPNYQPRVGRRTSPERLGAKTRALAQRMDVHRVTSAVHGSRSSSQ